MPQRPSRLHSLRSGARTLARRAAERVGLDEAAARLGGALTAAGTPLALAVGARIGDLVDAASSRLLSDDDAAAELAFAVESIADQVGRDVALGAVLKHNLLLDGTFLGLVSPLLSGQSEIAADPARLRGARATLVTLLEALVRLRDDDDPEQPVPPDDDRIEARFEALRAAAPDLPLDAVAPYLCGHRTDDDTAAFVLGSYSLFLQTFLLRSTVKLVPEVLARRTPQIEP